MLGISLELSLSAINFESSRTVVASLFCRWASEHVDPVFWGSVGFASRLLPNTGVDGLPDVLREAGSRSHTPGSGESRGDAWKEAKQGGGALYRWEQELEDSMADLAALTDGYESMEPHEYMAAALLGALKLLVILGLAGGG